MCGIRPSTVSYSTDLSPRCVLSLEPANCGSTYGPGKRSTPPSWKQCSPFNGVRACHWAQCAQQAHTVVNIAHSLPFFLPMHNIRLAAASAASTESKSIGFFQSSWSVLESSSSCPSVKFSRHFYLRTFSRCCNSLDGFLILHFHLRLFGLLWNSSYAFNFFHYPIPTTFDIDFTSQDFWHPTKSVTRTY